MFFTRNKRSTNFLAPSHIPFFRRAIASFTGITVTAAIAAGLLFAAPANAAENDIAEAQSQLTEAERALESIKQQRDIAASAYNASFTEAEQAKNQAQQARHIADEATRAYLRLLREGLSASTTLAGEALSSGEDKNLLTSLSIANKTSELFEENTSIGDRVVSYRETSTELTHKADEVAATVTHSDVEQRENDVTAAEADVANKRNYLETLTVQEAQAAAEKAKKASLARSVSSNPIIGGWVFPVVGQLSDGFGYRPSQPAGANLDHHGQDITANCGTQIYAASAGTVVKAGLNGSYGNWIEIDHGGGISTGYAHIQNGGIQVSVGQRVEAGTPIALVGSTGAATGCHLHFETHVNGSAVNPIPFLADRGIRK